MTADGALADLAGNAIARPGERSGQMLTPLPQGLAMLHDSTLGEDPEFLDAVRSAVAVSSNRRRSGAACSR